MGPVHYCPPNRFAKITGHYDGPERYTTAEEIMSAGNAVEVPPCNQYKLPEIQCVSFTLGELIST